VAPLQPAPDNAQLTPLLAGSFATVAKKLWVLPTATLAAGGDSCTEIARGVAATAIVAVAVFVPSATDVAVRVTLAGLGTAAGAV
jgi:hypothetical protein